MAQRTWNVKVKGSRIRFAAGADPGSALPEAPHAGCFGGELRDANQVLPSWKQDARQGPVRPTESRLPPDGVVAATRRKVSRRVLHLTTFHRLRIGRSWIGCRGSFTAVPPLRWIPEFPGRDVAGANR